MLRVKEHTLNELVSPQIEEKINEQVQARIAEALEERKRNLEEEIERKRREAERAEEEMNRAIEERKRKIQEEIDLEKRKLTQEPVHQAQVLAEAAKKFGGSQFESRLNYRRSSVTSVKNDARKSVRLPQKAHSHSSMYSFDDEESKNKVIVPSMTKSLNDADDNIIIISKN
jgi:hypothetical protein